jgi:hypothetical protein
MRFGTDAFEPYATRGGEHRSSVRLDILAGYRPHRVRL